MFSNIAKILITFIVIDDIVGQIEFPERFEIDKKKSNVAGRLPLYAPTRCQHDELLYPGDQENDWICDCAPASVYHPDTDACYPAFRQGPCQDGQFLVLPTKSVIPECIRNDCRYDGKILINHHCYTFGENPPCRRAELSYVLGVDPVTLLVDCVRISLSLATRFSEPEIEPQTNATNYDWNKLSPCPLGSKRIQRGTCQIVDKKLKSNR